MNTLTLKETLHFLPNMELHQVITDSGTGPSTVQKNKKRRDQR